MQSYDGNDITPPITPLKSRRKKEVSPINIEAATAHFKDAWTRTPIRSREDLSLDALDTPPLSAASTSGEISAPLDAIHPLFSRLTIDDSSDGKELGGLGYFWNGGLSVSRAPDDVFGISTQVDAPHTNDAPPQMQTPLLPSVPEFMSSRTTDQYLYSASSDTVAFFNSDPNPIIETKTPSSTSSPSTTPKANKRKHKGRRTGKARAIGGKAPCSPTRTTPTRTRTSVLAEADEGGGPLEREVDLVVARMPPLSPRTLSPASARRAALATAVVSQRVPFGSTAGNSRSGSTCGGAARRPLRDCTQNAPVELATSSGPKVLACLCGRTFTRQDSMERHIRTSVCRRAGLGLGL